MPYWSGTPGEGFLDLNYSSLRDTCFQHWAEEFVSVTGSGSVTLDCNSANIFVMTLTASCNITITNAVSGRVTGLTLYLESQTAGTFTFVNSVIWEQNSVVSAVNSGFSSVLALTTSNVGSRFHAFGNGNPWS